MSAEYTAGRAGEVASTPEAHGFEPPYSQDLEKLGREMAAGDWTTHDSHQPPAGLASAQFVLLECEMPAGLYRVDEVNWEPGLRYHLVLSDDGLPLCSAEGLASWATHVRVDALGEVWQYSECPRSVNEGWPLRTVGFALAPETHRKPGPWHESLMEVHRG